MLQANLAAASNASFTTAPSPRAQTRPGISRVAPGSDYRVFHVRSTCDLQAHSGFSAATRVGNVARRTPEACRPPRAS